MLPRADIITVSPVAAGVGVTRVDAIGDPRQQAFQRSLAGMVGKSISGAVLSRLNDGSYLVRVAGVPARMQLPAGAEPGSEVPLKLLSLEPRPTFQVGEGSAGLTTYSEAWSGLLPGAAGAGGTAGSAAAQASARAAALLGQAAHDAAAPLPALDADSSPATLSATARVLAGVLGAALKIDKPQSAVAARLPLLGAPTGSAQQLAAALQDGIAASGLFYEAHLAEWAGGARTLGELAREPQAQPGFAGATPLDPNTAQLINLQLTAREQGHIAWQGQLWPGQPLHLEIDRDGADGAPARDEPEAAPAPWRSGLRLRLPQLGDISATLVLAGSQLHIQVKAGDANAGELLRAHAGRLASALDAGGTPLASLNIETPRLTEPRHD